MLIAIATGIKAMTRVLNIPDTETSFVAFATLPTLSASDCHVRAGCRQPSDAVYESLQEFLRVGLDSDVEVGRLAPDPSPIGDGFAGRQRAAELDVDGQRLGPDQAPIQGGRNGQGIVDEGAVEPVVTTVELHVEAESIGNEPDDRIVRHGTGRSHRVLAGRKRDR